MPIYAQYNEAGVVFAVIDSATAPVGNFIESDSFDVLGWIKNGDTIEPAPVVQQYKTSDIDKTEWREAVMTPSEVLRIDKAESLIEGDLSWLVGSLVVVDDEIDIVAHAPLAPFAGFTYRDALRSTLKSFKDAPSLAVDNLSLRAGVYLLSITGLLDNPARVPAILRGAQL